MENLVRVLDKIEGCWLMRVWIKPIVLAVLLPSCQSMRLPRILSFPSRLLFLHPFLLGPSPSLKQVLLVEDETLHDVLGIDGLAIV